MNQDAFCLKRAETSWGDIALLVVCDGMGGLEKGELAAATVVRSFSSWFQEKLPILVEQLGDSEDDLMAAVQNQWVGLVQGINLKVMQHSRSHGISMGTTCTALLAFGRSFVVVHVGDTRAYCFLPAHEQCITVDHTFVQQEIAAGRLSRDDAANHPQRNALAQCVGASKALEPEVFQGSLSPDGLYVLCSDGFRRLLTPWEMNHVLRNAQDGQSFDNEKLRDALEQLVQVSVARGERDDITALILCPLDQECSEGGASC